MESRKTYGRVRLARDLTHRDIFACGDGVRVVLPAGMTGTVVDGQNGWTILAVAWEGVARLVPGRAYTWHGQLDLEPLDEVSRGVIERGECACCPGRVS